MTRAGRWIRVVRCSTLAALVVAVGVGVGPPVAAAPPVLAWAAAGDSYSSGTGLGDAPGGCDRDPFAYAPRAARDILAASFTVSVNHLACFGARTNDITNGQAGSITSAYNVASLTVGGNDIGFADKVAGCAIGSCGPDTMALQADVPGGSQTWDDIYRSLYSAYVAVRRSMAAAGHLYVLSYPIPFARQTVASCAGLSPLEQNAANALTTRLDDTIYWAVKRANELLPTVHGRAGNVHFVDWRTGTRVENGYVIPNGYAGAGQRFATYVTADGLCNTAGRTPFINGYVLSSNYRNSFHPTSRGYWQAAVAVADAIDRDY